MTIPFHRRLTVLVGVNGSGKTSILEGASIALGAFFSAFDLLDGQRIDKRDARLVSFLLDGKPDVQAQFPVEITAVGVVDERENIVVLDEQGRVRTTGKFMDATSILLFSV